jgi:hypothetical protein
MSTAKIVFHKMEQDTANGTGTIRITLGRQGENHGWIEKESTYTYRGYRGYKFTASSYEATAWGALPLVGDQPAPDFTRVFLVSDYNGPRAALAAAKQWVREIIEPTL